jgi:type V secretory pathway adhesin AidA
MNMRNVLGRVLLTLAAVAWGASAQASTITFDQVLDGGSLSYDGAGGALVGTDIRVDVITSADAPTPGTLDCVDCVLNFSTGANVTEGPVSWTFAAGGTFTIEGDAVDPNTNLTVASGVLLSGVFSASPISPSVVGNQFVLSVIAFGVDEKNPDLLEFFGLSANTEFTFANTELSATNITCCADGAFSGDVNEADVTNIQAVPDPGSTMALLGLGLMGVGVLRRKRVI